MSMPAASSRRQMAVWNWKQSQTADSSGCATWLRPKHPLTALHSDAKRWWRALNTRLLDVTDTKFARG